MRKFYVTTPIYYPNADLHVGHTYTTLIADALARYQRERGLDVLFLTGTDEHGQKIEESAKQKGLTPKQHLDTVVSGIKALWKDLDISYDRFIRTTDEYHKSRIQKIWNLLVEKGDIYLGKYEGYYCVPEEMFLTESQLNEGKCPSCGRDVTKHVEESYFFRLSKYQDRLLKLFEENPEILQPASRVSEMVNNFIKPGLEDLSITRTSFDWGIPVPGDEKHVIYVWIDALFNYLTAIGYPDSLEEGYHKYWPANVHLVGKEIVRFHTIIWFSLLMSLELPLPKKIMAHGWLMFGDKKMGKSTGNVVDPRKLVEIFGLEALKYFLLAEYDIARDGNFSVELLARRVNADLSNDFGNLLSRTVAMVEKYRSGFVPAPSNPTPYDEELITMASSVFEKFEANMENINFSEALGEIWKLITRANKYIDETMPWKLAKDDPQNQLDSVLYNLIEVLRIVGILVRPFLPTASQKLSEQIGVTLGKPEEAKEFGLYPAGTKVQKGDALFPRIDIEKVLSDAV